MNRLVSVGDDFTLPEEVNVADENLPDRLQNAALNATYAPAHVADAAKANGTNQTAYLQSLLDAAEVSSRVKTVEVNADFVATGLQIASNVTLRGSGSIKNPAAATGPVLTNKGYDTGGNTGITIDGLLFDGNREGTVGNQFYSTIDLRGVRKSKLSRLRVRGGCRSTTGSGGDGEGIVLKQCQHNTVTDLYLYENDYDGLKLRSSSYNTISNVQSLNNERSAIQLSFYRPPGDPGGFSETIVGGLVRSEYNTITNVNHVHETGVKARGGASTNSGIGLHGASNNTITNVSIWGTQAGFDFLEGSDDNHLSSFKIWTRGTQGGINMYTYGDANKLGHRNTISDGEVYGLELVGGTLLKVESQIDSTFHNIKFFRGTGTGAWVSFVSDTSSGTVLDRLDFASDNTFTDWGVATRITSGGVRSTSSPQAPVTVGKGVEYVFASGTATTITLPAPERGRTITVINRLTTGPVTVMPPSGSDIDGRASKQVFARNDKVTFFAGSAGWYVANENKQPSSGVIYPASNYTVEEGADVIIASGGGGYAITLPAVDKGRRISIVNNSTGSVTVQGAGTIDGAASKVLATRYEKVNLVGSVSTWVST